MMEIQPEAKSIYLIDLDTSAQYDRKLKPHILELLLRKLNDKWLKK